MSEEETSAWNHGVIHARRRGEKEREERKGTGGKDREKRGKQKAETEKTERSERAEMSIAMDAALVETGQSILLSVKRSHLVETSPQEAQGPAGSAESACDECDGMKVNGTSGKQIAASKTCQ